MAASRRVGWLPPLALGGCASLRGHGCRAGERYAVHESLGFGTAKPNGVVTPEEWDEFLTRVVTPRFPQEAAFRVRSGACISS